MPELRQGTSLKKLLSILLSCIAASAFAAGLSERAFTDMFVQQAKAALPDIEITIVAPLQLKTKAKDGSVGTVFLNNAYTKYSADPDGLQKIIDDHLASMKFSEIPVTAESGGSIFAVIKPADYLANVQAQRAKAGIKEEISLIVERLNDDLLVLYVLDSETSMQMLTKEGAQKAGIEQSALRSVAVKNLQRYFNDKKVQIQKIEQAGKATIYQVTLDENYEASILLIDDYWTKKNFDVAGDIVVFVPARNVVMVTGSEDKEGMRLASIVAQNGYDELGYAISPFGYRKGATGWQRVEP